jgi:hypothetical protein
MAGYHMERWTQEWTLTTPNDGWWMGIGLGADSAVGLPYSCPTPEDPDDAWHKAERREQPFGVTFILSSFIKNTCVSPMYRNCWNSPSKDSGTRTHTVNMPDATESIVNFMVLSFSGTGVWTEDLHLEPFHQPFFCEGFFRDRVSWTVCPGLALNRSLSDLCLLSS